MRPNPLPRALRVVAFLHLLEGVSSVVEIVVRLLHGTVCVDLGVLGIPIGLGLLRLSRPWRACSVVFLVVGFVLGCVVVPLTLFGSRPGTLDVFGFEMATVPGYGIAIVGTLFLVLTAWQLRVLVRPDVTRLFLAASSEGAAPASALRAAGS